MDKFSFLVKIFILICFSLSAVGKDKSPGNKHEAVSIIKMHQDELVGLSDQIWAYAETALLEYQSSEVLSAYAQQQGFQVEKGVAGLPTAFIASYGSGKPAIGILGEFDALPGLSQIVSTEKKPVAEGQPGHGCGHNLLGVGSFGAALAIKELLEEGKLKGAVCFFGTPAEETVGGKAYMAREGLFDSLDVCLDWHPSTSIEANAQSKQAMVDFRVAFTGKTAHAAVDPWNGISAVDALELYTTGINYLREHIPPTVRIHYLIEKAGEVVNVVPENAAVLTRVRDSKREGMYGVYEKIKKIAEGAALMTGAGYSIELLSGMHELLVNRAGAAVLQKNIEALGPIGYTAEELDFAKNIQVATGKKPTGLDGDIAPLRATGTEPQGGSSDVGDVSWNVPEITLFATTAPAGVPWHSWAVVACGGMSIGHKGMLFASKALAMTMVDLFEDRQLVESIRDEFVERKGEVVYKAILPDGPPPIPEK